MLAALMVHVGLVSVLARTNNDPLQFFIVLLLATSIYLIVSWQYCVGRCALLWSQEAERQWRGAAWFFGAALAVGLGVGIVSFHMHASSTKAERGAPPNGGPAASVGKLGVTEGPPSVS